MQRRGPCIFLILAMGIGTSWAQEASTASPDWMGSVEQKIAGLSTIWAEAKFNFPYFDQVPDLDWDAKYREFIPRVMAASNPIDYYQELTAFAALLQDGHTSVIPPWRFIKPGYDQPPVEVVVLDGKFFVAKTGETEEMTTQRIYPGLEILEVGEGMPVGEYFETQILPYSCQGTRQAHESVGMMSFFSGPKETPLKLKVKDGDGTVRSVVLSRNAMDKNGRPFYGRLLNWYLFEPIMKHRFIAPGILYVQLSNFMKEELNMQFEHLLDSLDVSTLKGMILDVRFNPGGNSTTAWNIVSCLTDTALPASKWKSLKYIPAYRSWGRKTAWEEQAPDTIEPREGKRYLGPVVVLTGKATFSSAEDFLVPLKQSGRAILIGEKTAGSTGNPIYVDLPGGGKFRVVSKRDLFPDETEFVGYGIAPDVLMAPTQKDLLENRDGVLEKAIEVLKNGAVK